MEEYKNFKYPPSQYNPSILKLFTPLIFLVMFNFNQIYKYFMFLNRKRF
jgi:hypothetical protein